MDASFLLVVFAPSLAALAIASVAVLVSLFFKGDKQAIIQIFVFSSLLLLSLSYVVQNSAAELIPLMDILSKLKDETRLALSILLVCIVYFGGSFYVSVGNSRQSEFVPDSSVLNTPASIDSVVTFDIPELPTDEVKLFNLVFEKLKREIVADLPTLYEMPPEAVAWVDRMIQYTVAGGKMNRGLSLMAVQRTLAEACGKTLNPKERLQSAALGWCVEFLQAFFLVADDVMDASVTRRGQPCWFRLPEVKLIAINDSFLLESCVFKILKRYFGAEPFYGQLVDLFMEVTRQTELGQLLDLTSQPQDSALDLSRFTQARYSSIVIYKTAFYSFYLPVALGMIVSGVTERRLYAQARRILLIMGEYFQVQDDYLDCYGAPEVIGKVGTDIQDNKCGWLVVQALQRATPAQRQVLEQHYGRHGDEHVERVKALYREMDITALFQAYEEQSYRQIQRLVDECTELPRPLFEFLLAKIYKRSK